MPTADVDPWLRELIARMHREIGRAVREDLGSKTASLLSTEARRGAGDVSFEIDVRPEEIVKNVFASAPQPVLVICEGLGRVEFPTSAEEGAATWCVIVDPLDGSREISYGKRSAWVLTGVAPAGPQANLADIVWAMQTEVPPLAQGSATVLSVAKGEQVTMETWNLTTGSAERYSDSLGPSDADSIRGGYAVFADYFAGIHELTGRIADAVLGEVLGSVDPGEALVFNDQYLSTAGCMYLLVSGRYRFYADLRPLIWAVKRGAGLCAHPYDLCTSLIAQQAGAILTDPYGDQLSYALSTDLDCAWVGYANESIRKQVEPALQRGIRELGTFRRA